MELADWVYKVSQILNITRWIQLTSGADDIFGYMGLAWALPSGVIDMTAGGLLATAGCGTLRWMVRLGLRELTLTTKKEFALNSTLKNEYWGKNKLGKKYICNNWSYWKLLKNIAFDYIFKFPTYRFYDYQKTWHVALEKRLRYLIKTRALR